ncbi:MAG: asparagine synthase (glutamine-hydrolyzing) [Pseudomonadales bacterium]|nr:asparagine synthase (glutamine-hydrolyzing) [Pseudomonadales bacterium]
MCGIAGIYHTNQQQPVNKQLLANMAAIQYHRGPDGFGVKTFDNAGVGFSHARLSIIDLNEDRGKQPFISNDERLLLAHNGEFYDYQKIRARLTALGDRFRTKSDSEIILNLYPRFGMDETLKQLRGEFAFALFDRQQDCLYLVRDRFGIKPLYWANTPEGVVFGSELKVLFAHPGVSRKFSATGLYHQLMQTMVPGTTAFDGIHQVKPGYVVKLQRQNGTIQVSEECYWDMPFPTMQERKEAGEQPEAYWIEKVREGLLEAVSLRMEADVPVGCYLSGGIDSCSILGLAAACSQNPVKAFTISFDDDVYDEAPIATQMAEATGAEQDIMRLSGNELYGHFEKTIWHTERTIYNTLAVAKFLMSNHVNHVKYKVVMTGEGSDELFGGYPAFRRDMFLHGLDTLSQSERNAWEQALNSSNEQFRGAMLAEDALEDEVLNDLVGFTPSCLQPWLASAKQVPGVLSGDFREQLAGYEPGTAIAEGLNPAALKDRHPLDKAQYVWIKTMLEGQILTWGGDRVDMANSMEARPAFLDHHLAEMAANIPPNLRIKEKTEKYVLREAMKGVLPEVLYKREKFAFMAPPAHTDKTKWAQMKKLADKFLNKDSIEAAGLLSYEGVQSLFEYHESDKVSAAEQVQLDAVINHMLGVQMMHQHFIADDVPEMARQKAFELGWLVAES